MECLPGLLMAMDGAHAGGFEWKPPQQLKHLLLVADATALPAAKRTFSICAIYLISDPAG
jgi:NADPH-dependent ferric siderophore reductase